MKKSQNLKRLLKCILFFASVLILLELVFKTFYKNDFFSLSQTNHKRYELDGKLMFKLRAKQYSELKFAGQIDKLQTNNLGFRSVNDTYIKKPEGNFRIIVVGDSFAYGYGLSNSGTYPQKLENVLNKNSSYPIYEVINAAVPGYSPDQEYRLISEKLTYFQPNLIIWNIINYDLLDLLYNSASLYKISENNQLTPDRRINWQYFLTAIQFNTPDYLRKSHLINFLMTVLFHNRKISGAPNLSEKEMLDWSRAKMIVEFTTASELAKKNKFRLIIVRLPTKEDFGLKKEDLGFKKLKNVYDTFFNEIENELETDGITYFNLTNSLKSHTDPVSLFFQKDIHPNEKGAETFAMLLQQYLLANDFLQ